MKHIVYLLLLACLPMTGQTLSDESLLLSTTLTEPAAPMSCCAAVRPFSHLDLSLTGGTTGVGFDLATPLSSSLQLRAGFSALPHFDYNMYFGVQVGNDPATSQSKFERLSGLLESFTGYRVDDRVKMIGKPAAYHASLMLDVMPLRDKRWHVTAGFFIGPEKFARAYNATEDMPSLVAVGIYNNIYDRVADKLSDPAYFSTKTLAEVIDDISILRQLGFDASKYDVLENFSLDPDDNPVKSAYERIVNYGRMGIHIGDYTHDVYYEEDELYTRDTHYEKFVFDDEGNILFWPGDVEHAAGEVKHHKGEVKHQKGDPYMLTPDESSMVRANFLVNNFRPYLGFGYGGRLSKSDDRWKISFDCGAMFWGGTPRIVTHEGVDLCRDVTNISGDVGRYVRFFKQFKAYPVLNLRITRRLF